MITIEHNGQEITIDSDETSVTDLEEQLLDWVSEVEPGASQEKVEQIVERILWGPWPGGWEDGIA